jgi:hypothetical protein
MGQRTVTRRGILVEKGKAGAPSSDRFGAGALGATRKGGTVQLIGSLAGESLGRCNDGGNEWRDTGGERHVFYGAHVALVHSISGTQHS